tara:strand:+ start:1795 stop:2880 length:1086 start_codon:yes stop_codon:yes gene_type:complete
MYNKVYVKHIYEVYFSRLILITIVFASLIFIMNILEELKFFSKTDTVGIGYPILLTILNLPSILFEIFPFIILITTQFFFMKFQANEEILIFKNNGINNLKIILHVCLLVFIIGILIISLFHFISSSMKNNYLEFKNKYTQDNKYLAVITENGLWIKDKMDDKFLIIHSEKIDKNILKNLVITTFDEEFKNEKSIIAEEANISDFNWTIKEAISIDSFGERKNYQNLRFKTNFDYIKINSLFSNLESLNIFELLKQKKDFQSVGLNVLDIDIYLNKIFSLPISLVIFSLLSSILMLNIKFKKSKTKMIIVGILLSVIIYYIYYFFGLLGSNNKIPVILAIWLPNLIIFLSCLVGIVNINEK